MMYYWRRIGSFVIDFTIVGMFTRIIESALFFLLGNAYSISYESLSHDYFIAYISLGLTIAVAVGYNVGCYHFFKFPLGKMLMTLKVYNHRGRRVSTKEYAKREFYKFIYLYATLGLYAPYQFFRYVVKKEQTFHERQTNTYIYM